MTTRRGFMAGLAGVFAAGMLAPEAIRRLVAPVPRVTLTTWFGTFDVVQPNGAPLMARRFIHGQIVNLIFDGKKFLAMPADVASNKFQALDMGHTSTGGQVGVPVPGTWGPPHPLTVQS
jgi:hypothetical protein